MAGLKQAVGVAGLALLLWSGEAAANRDPDLPRPDPKGTLRIAAYGDAESTSTCIGRSPTPMCAVDNYFLCTLRGDERSCYAALHDIDDSPDDDIMHIFIDPDDVPLHLTRPVNERPTTVYRVVIANQVRYFSLWQKDLRHHGFRPDDVIIVVKEHNCFGERMDPGCRSDTEGVYHSHFLRKIDGEWRNIAWGTDETTPWQAINMVLKDSRMDEVDRGNYLKSLNNLVEPPPGKNN